MTARREKRATPKVYGARGLKLKRCWEFLELTSWRGTTGFGW
jgi:hypothetical protein